MKCTKFHQCSAPLCPLWEEWLHSSVWTVGEEICTKVFPGGKPRWIRIQRRIARRLAGVKDVGFFTVRMLSRVGAVTPTLRGLSPDLADKDWLEREEAWCRQRKPITPKAYTEEERERLRQAGLRLKKRATVPAQKMSDVERDSQVMSEGRDATSRHERAL